MPDAEELVGRVLGPERAEQHVDRLGIGRRQVRGERARDVPCRDRAARASSRPADALFTNARSGNARMRTRTISRASRRTSAGEKNVLSVSAIEAETNRRPDRPARPYRHGNTGA